MKKIFSVFCIKFKKGHLTVKDIYEWKESLWVCSVRSDSSTTQKKI
jgi:hypothetical protein